MTSPFTISDILEGSVGILNNYNLCHIKTIEWNEIITGQNAKYLYVYKFQEKERDCTPCHETCDRGCWGEGSNNCQKFSKINCSPQCHQGRCFGSQPRECCHLFCAGGCTGPKQSDCLVSNFVKVINVFTYKQVVYRHIDVHSYLIHTL
jgi:epidermal growth factor receptor